jgi:sugar phosphate isomerase/epimerase
MYFTGFADEAAADIDRQIQATRELGWTNIEGRAVDGVNLHDLDQDQFERIVAKLDAAGVRINCFGSAVANWAKKIDAPFDSSLREAERAIPRMHRLGTHMIRIMSFAVLDPGDPDRQMKEERFRRLRKLVQMFSEAGILPVHENCMNYGGMGWKYTIELIENVPGLKLVFDTGNPVFTDDRTKQKPWPKQSSLEFYHHVKEHIAYIHIKDAVWDAEIKKPVYTYPGDGHGNVKEILKDMICRGYDGGISIEPHLGAVFHDPGVHAAEAKKYAMYIEYGRRIERMVKAIKAELYG